MSLSKNCDEHTDHVSSIVTVSATHKDSKLCKIDASVMSCQEIDYENPDKKTMETIFSEVRKKSYENPACAGLSDYNGDFEYDLKTVIVGAKTTELSGKDLNDRMMASNCADGFDLRKVTNHNQFECFVYGDLTYKDGTKTRNYGRAYTGRLPSCENSFDLADETVEDIKKVVKYNIEQNEHPELGSPKVNMKDISCRIFSPPLP